MRCATSTPALPAASLRPAKRLPATRPQPRRVNYMILLEFCRIKQAFFGAESSFLPALREAPGDGRSSASHALGAGADVVERQRHRGQRVIAHQEYDVGDPDMAERLDRAVVEPFCDPARIGKTRRRFVDELLALVLERRVKTRPRRRSAPSPPRCSLLPTICSSMAPLPRSRARPLRPPGQNRSDQAPHHSYPQTRLCRPDDPLSA